MTHPCVPIVDSMGWSTGERSGIPIGTLRAPCEDCRANALVGVFVGRADGGGTDVLVPLCVSCAVRFLFASWPHLGIGGDGGGVISYARLSWPDERTLRLGRVP